MQSSGSDSPKLTTHLSGQNFQNGGGQLGFPTISASAHAFNLAAFRSPGFLGAHGFAFSGNFGYSREHSPSAYENNQTGLIANNSGVSPGNHHNHNSNSPQHQQYNSGRSSPIRDGFLSDYYNNHNNNSNKNVDRLSGGDCVNSDIRDRSINQSFERDSESPDLAARSSPVDSSRSYPSQKSDEAGYHSPHPDSIGSRSPENLSGKKITSDMLDHHKLPLSFLGPPLAALHSMTEMKSGGIHQTTPNSHGAPNPHGIDTILSRPPPVTSAGLNALTNGKLFIA